jgi:hypothetical protein
MYFIVKIKMAKSRTSKKRIKHLAYRMAEAQVVENLLNYYLTWWTKQEIQNLVKQGDLVILPLENDGLQVAHFKILPDHKIWKVVNAKSSRELCFNEKLCALFYCLYEHKKMYRSSAELLLQDTLLGKLENDEQFYRHKYTIALKKQDRFKQDLWEARLSYTTPHVNLAREQLQKMIKRAKYIKIWD